MQSVYSTAPANWATGHLLGSLTPLQRYSRCILQPHVNWPTGHLLESLTPLQRCSRCILQPHVNWPTGHLLESLTPLQRCSRCILQPHVNWPTGHLLESLTPLQGYSRCILQPHVNWPTGHLLESLTPVGVCYSLCRVGHILYKLIDLLTDWKKSEQFFCAYFPMEIICIWLEIPYCHITVCKLFLKLQIWSYKKLKSIISYFN